MDTGFNLYGGIRPESQNKQLGEKFSICCQFINKVGPPAPLLYLSSKFNCFDALNNPIVVDFTVVTMRTTANGGVQLYYPMYTGPNQTITLPGTYRYVFSVRLSDGTVQDFEQVALVNSNP